MTACTLVLGATHQPLKQSGSLLCRVATRPTHCFASPAVCQREKQHPAAVFAAGWDVFTLKYEVEEPIATVLDQEAMKRYLRIFKLLWALKRAEHSLNDCWVDLNSVQRQLTTFPSHVKRAGAEAYSESHPPGRTAQRFSQHSLLPCRSSILWQQRSEVSASKQGWAVGAGSLVTHARCRRHGEGVGGAAAVPSPAQRDGSPGDQPAGLHHV